LISQASLGFCYFGIYAVLLNLYLLRLDYSLKYISLVNAAGQLTFALSSPLAGIAGRRWNNRKVMVLGMSLNLVGFGLLPLLKFKSPHLEAVWLVVVYAVAWLGLSLLIVNIIPFLMDVTCPEERNHVFSMVGAVLSLSGFLGSLVAGLLPSLFSTVLDSPLSQPTPYRYPLLFAAVLLIPGLLALLATRDPSVEQQQKNVFKVEPGRLDLAPLGLIILLTVVMLLMRTSEGAVRTFFNVYLDDELRISTALIATLSAAGQLLAVPAALAAPLLIGRLGLGRTVILGNLGMACSLLPLALIPHWTAAGLGFMGVMTLISFTVPAFGVYHQELMPLRWRTAMSGAATMAVGLSWASITLGGGYVITNLGYTSFFLMGAALTTAGGLLFWAHFRHKTIQVTGTFS
jgi:MFS family permease